MIKNLGIITYWKTAFIVSILLLCFQTYSYAADITLEWDPNPSYDYVDHYVIYWGTSSGAYTDDSGNIDKGTTTYTVHGLDTDKYVYYFAAKAFDTAGLGSDYSNVVSTAKKNIPSGTGGSGGGCFIATAAYGSYLDPHIKILKNFRDRYLLTNIPGRAFVKFYYNISPPIATFISKHETLKPVSRWAITPVVYCVAYPYLMAVFLLIPAGIGLVVIHRKRARC